MVIKDQQIEKYFKGEKRSCKSLYGTSESIRQNKNTTINLLKKKVAQVLNDVDKNNNIDEFIIKYMNCFSNGPEWIKEVYANLVDFLNNNLYQPLVKINQMLQENKEK